MLRVLEARLEIVGAHAAKEHHEIKKDQVFERRGFRSRLQHGERRRARAWP